MRQQLHPTVQNGIDNQLWDPYINNYKKNIVKLRK